MLLVLLGCGSNSRAKILQFHLLDNAAQSLFSFVCSFGFTSQYTLINPSVFINYRICFGPQKRERVISIDGYKYVKPNDEEALMCAVSSQPVSVAINAGTKDFQLYADVSLFILHNIASQ